MNVWILRTTEPTPTTTTQSILLTLLTLVFCLEQLFQHHSLEVPHLLHILLLHFRCRASICIYHRRLRLLLWIFIRHLHLSLILQQVYTNTSVPVHSSLSAVTHAPFHASMLRPASQAGPMHEAAWVGEVS